MTLLQIADLDVVFFQADGPEPYVAEQFFERILPVVRITSELQYDWLLEAADIDC